MAGLKELRIRIESIKSTQKITSAMKMVAAARLRKAQGLIASSEPYARALHKDISLIWQDIQAKAEKGAVPLVLPPLLQPVENAKDYLLLVITSDRGLCGSFNSAVIKAVVSRIEELKKSGKNVKLYCLGKKGADVLKHRYGDMIAFVKTGIAKKGADYAEAEEITEELLQRFLNKEFDVCEMVVSHFKSAISRDIRVEPFLPLKKNEEMEEAENPVHGAFYEFEPEPENMFADILKLYAKSVFFRAIVNSQASEQGARMSSMDNATRNAKDMIAKLTLRYNRIRQTAITTELIEIIAGAEAI